MNRTEIIALLGYCKGLDGRIDNGEITTEAWHNILPQTLTLQTAINYAQDHYSPITTTIMPAYFIGRNRTDTTPIYKPTPIDNRPDNKPISFHEWYRRVQNGKIFDPETGEKIGPENVTPSLFALLEKEEGRGISTIKVL